MNEFETWPNIYVRHGTFTTNMRILESLEVTVSARTDRRSLLENGGRLTEKETHKMAWKWKKCNPGSQKTQQMGKSRKRGGLSPKFYTQQKQLSKIKATFQLHTS